MLVTFLGRSCASCFFTLKFFGLFYFNEFHQKRAFMFSHFFPFIFFVFNCSVFNYNSNNNDALSNSAKRERLVCWIQRSLSRSLSSSVLLCFARSLSLLTQFCWLSENIKNARETFCSKLLTTFINSMCVCVCAAIVYQQIAAAARAIKQCRHTLNSFFFHTDTLLLFFLFHKTQTTLDTLCRQANRV